jgi:predicted MFS family arabinose efflux permease
MGVEPTAPRKRRATGFEDRGAHRDPTTPGAMVARAPERATGRYPPLMPASLLLTLAVFVVGVDIYIVAAVLPAIADDLGEKISAVGLLASAYALPTALLAPVFGPLSDQRGRRFALVLGLGLFLVAVLACTVAPTLPMLLAARAINGVGSAILLPAAFAWAGDLPDPVARNRTIAVLSSTFPLSNLLGLPIGALATIVLGWRGPFLLIAIVAAIVLLGLARSRDVPADRSATAGYAQTFREVLRDRRALAVMLVTVVWFSGAVGMFVYVAEFFHQAFAIPSDQAGLAYLAVGVVGVIAARTSDRVIARIGARRTVLLGMLGFIGGVAVLPQTGASLPLALVVFAVWASGTWIASPAMNGIVAGLSETARATMLAFNSSAFNLGAVIGPIVSGRIIETRGFGAAGAWSAALGLVALVLAWRVLPRDEPGGSSDPPMIH